MNIQLRKSILTSYLIGAPIGIFAIASLIIIPSFITGEGLLTMVMLGVYSNPIIGLVISFLIALWIGGKLAFENINNGKSLILTSFKYSVIVNLIIWSTFCIIILLSNEEDKLIVIIPPIIAFIVCTILTTFTIGLLICYIIKKINLVKLI